MVPSAAPVRLPPRPPAFRPLHPRRRQVRLPPARPLRGARPGVTRLGNFSSAADCASTLRCLSSPGGRVSGRSTGCSSWARFGASRAAPAPSSGQLRLHPAHARGGAGRPAVPIPPHRRRFALAAADGAGGGPRAGDGRDPQSTDGRPPLTIEGAALSGIRYGLGSPSAQVKTAILLAGMQATGARPWRSPTRAATTPSACCPLRRGLEVSGGATPSVAAAASGATSRWRARRRVQRRLPAGGRPRPSRRPHLRVEGVLLSPQRTAVPGRPARHGRGAWTCGLHRPETPEPVGLDPGTARPRGCAA